MQYGGEWNGNYNPKYGNEFLYSKTSAFGSLINTSLYYTQVNSRRSLGTEYEYAYKGVTQKCLKDGGLFKISGYKEISSGDCNEFANALL